MLKKARIEELAQKALSYGNPYKAQSVMFYVDMKPMYLRFGVKYTGEELDKAYLETARKDIENGYKERMVGYYDKWYRYNHADEGRAYDLGVKEATTNEKCKDYCNIIECVA